MLSKNRTRFLISLRKKKVREEEGLFIIEGDKLVREFLSAGIRMRMLVAKREFILSLDKAAIEQSGEIEEATFDDLKIVSTMKTPHNALAVIPVPGIEFNAELLTGKLIVALDCIQDPGNLGTIIRAAAWFGIETIVCSPDSVDVYNPKVVQASMGALLHVNVYYSDINSLAQTALSKEIPVYGTVLDGESIYSATLKKSGIIILGNESKGISPGLLPLITNRLMIPGAGSSKPGIESLNVGMAASVVFSEFLRRKVV
jgi:RNA methyltransferase, TrmH family